MIINVTKPIVAEQPMSGSRRKDWAEIARTFLHIASDILPKLPNKNDGPLQLAIKGLAICDSVNRLFTVPESPEDIFIRKHGLTKVYDFNFIEFFCNSKLRSLFQETQIKIESGLIVHCYNKELGSIYWTEYNRTQLGLYYIDDKFNAANVMQRIWSLYTRGFVLDVDGTNPYGINRRKFNPIPKFEDPIAKETDKQLREFVSYHISNLNKNRSRCYLFIGPPGTGKTTFAQHVAEKLSNQILKITADAFLDMRCEYFDFLMQNLKPDTLIIDDIDRCLYSYKLLSVMENIPRQYKWLTVMLTGNKLTDLDPALVRPSRIDDVIEFDLPNERERIELLKLYMDKEISDTYIQKIAKLTEGMSHAWIKEVALQMSLETEDRLVTRIKKMLRITGQLKQQEELTVSSKRKRKNKKTENKRIRMAAVLL